MAQKKKPEQRGLGRGLSALMADVTSEAVSGDAPPAAERTVPIEQVRPNPDQPRRSFVEAALNELTESIRAKGIIQPLIVREDPRGAGHYEIVAGERRWRAAQRVPLHEVPVIVRALNDVEVMEFAIVENVQRADLNPIEEGAAYRQLIERFGHTQEHVAEALGKSRSHIANLMRLLTLPDAVQEMLRDGRLTMGHARAVVTAADPEALARQIVKKGLSVRQAEALAKQPVGDRERKPPAPQKDADTRGLEQDLSAALNMPVRIDYQPGQENGSVTISYKTLEQLDDLCRRLSVTATAPMD